MKAMRDTILAALEQSCRTYFSEKYSPLHRMTSDETAVNWGPHAPELARAVTKMTGLPVTYQQTRRVLAQLVKAGVVLRASPHSRVVRFWPVGLWDKLQQERAAPTGEGSANAT